MHSQLVYCLAFQKNFILAEEVYNKTMRQLYASEERIKPVFPFMFDTNLLKCNFQRVLIDILCQFGPLFLVHSLTTAYYVIDKPLKFVS